MLQRPFTVSLIALLVVVDVAAAIWLGVLWHERGAQRNAPGQPARQADSSAERPGQIQAQVQAAQPVATQLIEPSALVKMAPAMLGSR